MCSREAKFSLSLHCFSAGVYILFHSVNIVFIASLQSPFVLCDSRALPRTCFNRLWALARDVFKQRAFSTVLRPLSQIPTLLYHSFLHNHPFLISPQHYQACPLLRIPLSRPSLPLQVRIIASGPITSSPGSS